ncbi:MAG: AMP-binding protein [Deltaproteobacteria bacterium]
MNRLDLRAAEKRLLGSMLRRQADEIPDRDFLIEDGRRITYGEANRLACSAASGFRALGVVHGDTVAFLMGSCPEFALAALGLNKLGGIWVPTNTEYKGRWLEESLQDSRARVLVVDGELLPKLAGLRELPFEQLIVRGSDPGTLDLPRQSLDEFLAQAGEEPDEAGLHFGQTAAVLFTSGTTGRAKGVMQSHNVWIQGAESTLDQLDLKPDDVAYNCLPMYQSAAWVGNLFLALAAGIPCAMDPAFSASAFWDRLRHFGATVTITLGAMHIFLWQADERDDDADNPLRAALMVPMPDEIEADFKKRFGIERIIQAYGQSEAMPILRRTPGRSWKANSLGEPHPLMEVRLLDEFDEEVSVGEVGEIAIRTSAPFVFFNGYFHNAEATARAFRNLWYHSGDLVRQDADGDYFFVDRKADYIRFKGRNISSFHVEAAAAAHPAVAAAAAHGVQSDELASESELKLVIVRAPDADIEPEDLARFIGENAPYFFVPRYIEILDALPMTPTGRVQKYKLRERGITKDTWDAKTAGFRPAR